MTPTAFKPTSANDFIGSAGTHAHLLDVKVCKLIQDRAAFLRVLCYGPPGTGKSECALWLAHTITGHPLAVEQLNGQSMSVDLVRDWRRNAGYRSLYGHGWTARIVDELDRSSDAAQAELLTWLDARHPQTAFIATTNQPLTKIPERLHTRMQLYKFNPVATSELATFIATRWGLPIEQAKRIAEANSGNVRGALNDTETWLDREERRMNEPICPACGEHQLQSKPSKRGGIWVWCEHCPPDTAANDGAEALVIGEAIRRLTAEVKERGK